jgi:hypothetical protein
MRYYIKIHVNKVLHFEVDAASKEDAINEVYYGEIEPCDEEILETKVCVSIESEKKEEPDTPLEGCELW